MAERPDLSVPTRGSGGVAVVIATRDRPELLEGALAAVAAAMRPADELVVVDSASRGTATLDVARAAGVRAIRCDRPGASIARNAGVAATSAPLVAVTDDDCLPEPGWCAAIEGAFTDESVAFVTGRVVPDRADADLPASEQRTERVSYRGRVDPMHTGHGANMAFRRDAFDRVGGYDEALGPGARFANAEDHDLLWRLLDAGWEGRYEPEATVVHRAWRNRRELFSVQYAYGVGSGAFAAKVLRSDRRAGMRLLRARLWDEGLVLSARLLGRGWQRPALAELTKVAGVCVGAARSARTPIVEGRYVP